MWREKFNELTARIKDSKEEYWRDDLEALEDSIKQCGEYIKSVNNMEAAITSARFRMEPEDYREYIMQLDNTRRIEHNYLIRSVRLINKLCSIYRVEPIYKGDLDNRIEIAEFAKSVVDEMFDTRQM
jgi:Protein of unknown function (DUF3232).